MSGGVDSSVVASLLKDSGHDVLGVFLKFWQDKCSIDSENKCCSSDSLKRAKKVAKILDIPFYVYDCSQEFKKNVVDYFIKEYSQGKTPNPCVVCNKKIKFGFLFDKMKAIGANYLATGHYIIKKESRIKNPCLIGRSPRRRQELRYKLFRARDSKKDQTYFLYNLNQEKLSKLLFPLGDYKKSKVRQLAKKFKLPVAKTRESQDVCFLPREGLEIFLKKYIKNIVPGLIFNTEGKKVGMHQGLPFYTIGQRKGIKIGGGKPYYVVEKNIEANKLVVTQDLKDERLLTTKFEVFDINWLSTGALKFPQNVYCQVRYRQKVIKAKIAKYDKSKKTCLVELEDFQRAVTSGQSAVFYKGEELLGGGIIK